MKTKPKRMTVFPTPVREGEGWILTDKYGNPVKPTVFATSTDAIMNAAGTWVVTGALVRGPGWRFDCDEIPRSDHEKQESPQKN